MPSEQGVFSQFVQVLDKGRRLALSSVHNQPCVRSLTEEETAGAIAALQEHRLGLMRYFKSVIEHDSDIGFAWDEIAEEVLLKCLELDAGKPRANFDFVNLVLVGKTLILDKLKPKLSQRFQHALPDEQELALFVGRLIDTFLGQHIDPYLHCAWFDILVKSGEAMLALRGDSPLNEMMKAECELSSAEKVREILGVVANAKCSDSFAYCIVHQLRSFARLHPDIMDIISFKILMGLPDKLILRDQEKNNGAYRQLCSDRLKKLMTYFEVCEVHLGGDHVD